MTGQNIATTGLYTAEPAGPTTGTQFLAELLADQTQVEEDGGCGRTIIACIFPLFHVKQSEPATGLTD